MLLIIKKYIKSVVFFQFQIQTDILFEYFFILLLWEKKKDQQDVLRYFGIIYK